MQIDSWCRKNLFFFDDVVYTRFISRNISGYKLFYLKLLQAKQAVESSVWNQTCEHDGPHDESTLGKNTFDWNRRCWHTENTSSREVSAVKTVRRVYTIKQIGLKLVSIWFWPALGLGLNLEVKAKALLTRPRPRTNIPVWLCCCRVANCMAKYETVH